VVDAVPHGHWKTSTFVDGLTAPRHLRRCDQRRRQSLTGFTPEEPTCGPTTVLVKHGRLCLVTSPSTIQNARIQVLTRRRQSVFTMTICRRLRQREFRCCFWGLTPATATGGGNVSVVARVMGTSRARRGEPEDVVDFKDAGRGVCASVTRRRAREALTDAQQRLRRNAESCERAPAARLP
jgi:hypothetical protein